MSGSDLDVGSWGVCLAALVLIAALPGVFFRRGRLTRGWWLTALPFFVSGTTLIAGPAGALEPFPLPPGVRALLHWTSIGLACVGVALVTAAIASHARPVSLWHQPDDRPTHVTTGGAYALVRHPFYTGFLCVLAAAALALPHVLTLGAALYAVFRLDRTAAAEERRLLCGEGGDEYAEYVRRTRRLLPGPRAYGRGRRPSRHDRPRSRLRPRQSARSADRIRGAIEASSAREPMSSFR